MKRFVLWSAIVTLLLMSVMALGQAEGDEGGDNYCTKSPCRKVVELDTSYVIAGFLQLQDSSLSFALMINAMKGQPSAIRVTTLTSPLDCYASVKDVNGCYDP